MAIGDAWVDGSWVDAGWVSGAWFAAGGAVSPTVDAGGPYTGQIRERIQLDATVTPGSDPAPTYLWTIQSGPGLGGTFDDATALDAIFIPRGSGTYVLLLTVSTADTADVTDTATVRVLGSAIGAKPQYPKRINFFGKRFTVRSEHEERELLRRLIAEEQAKAERAENTVKARRAVQRARVRVRQTKARLAQLERPTPRHRDLDEQLLLLMAENPWL